MTDQAVAGPASAYLEVKKTSVKIVHSSIRIVPCPLRLRTYQNPEKDICGGNKS
jgi:hypothetical protein